MKIFVVFDHIQEGQRLLHRPVAQCYALTIEDAIGDFCLFLSMKHREMCNVQFCMQQVYRSQADTAQWETVGATLGVDVHNLSTRTIELHWDIDHG